MDIEKLADRLEQRLNIKVFVRMRPPASGKFVDVPWVVSDDHKKIALKGEYSMRTVTVRPHNPPFNRSGSLSSFKNKQSQSEVGSWPQSSAIEPQTTGRYKKAAASSKQAASNKALAREQQAGKEAGTLGLNRHLQLSLQATKDKSARPTSQRGTNQERTASMKARSVSSLGNQYEFGFDKVFIPGISTNDVYVQSVQPLLRKAMASKTNFTLFMYGQTGGGKTYTMIGNRQSCQSGVLHMALSDILFQSLSKRPAPSMSKVSVSYLQIYNERISDLLHPGEN